MENLLVTAIIPVYKTEKYIKECIDSVLKQSYSNIEILLVDDESPDICGEMCEQFAAEYKNIRAFHQTNGGVGKARNTGFDAAHGDYIFYLDSDDLLDDDRAIEALVTAARENNADIVQGAYRKLINDKPQPIKVCGVNNNDIVESPAFRYKGFYSSGHLSYAWGKLYKREFLLRHGIRTELFRFTQDKLYNMMCYANRPRYAFVDTSICLYRTNEESVTFKYKKNYVQGWTEISKHLYEYLNSLDNPPECFDFIAFHILFGAIFVARQELVAHNGSVAAAEMLKQYSTMPLVEKSFTELSNGQYLSAVDGIFMKTAYKSFAKWMLRGRYSRIVLGIRLLIRLKKI